MIRDFFPGSKVFRKETARFLFSNDIQIIFKGIMSPFFRNIPKPSETVMTFEAVD